MTNPEMQVIELPANFLEMIADHNHYMRLGLRTNEVTLEEIQLAWQLKREAFDQARVGNLISYLQFGQGMELIQEAYDTLSDPERRSAYDKMLYKAHRKAAKKANPSPPDDFASRYTMEDLVHQGRRAKLWVAHDQRISRKVLIKELHPSLVRTEEQRQHFQEECGFYASSNATHLVKVLDYDEKSFRVVMEWLPDHMGDASRRRWEEGGDFSHHEIREFLRQCLRGLQVLHSRQWVHGRLSPSHLLLDDHGNIKLSITPGLRESSTATAPTSDILHIAPEMLRPDIFGPVTPASDLYVLGFIALDLITRNQAVEQIDPTSDEQRTDQERWYRWHASPVDTLPSTAEWMHGVPEDILNFLVALTHKQPAKRPADAVEALKILEELTSTLSPTAGGMEGSAQATENSWEDMETVHLGMPPALHDAQYEELNLTTWQAFKKSTSEWFEANPQRKWLAIGSIVTALILMLSAVTTAPNEAALDSQDIAAEEEPRTAASPPPRTTPPSAQAGNGQSTTQEAVPAPSKAVAQAADPSPFAEVFFKFPKEKGKVSIPGHTPSQADGLEWSLAPGDYVAKVDYGKRESLELKFQVPKDIARMEIPIVLQPSSTAPSFQSSVAETPDQKWNRKSFRADIPFDIVASPKSSYRETMEIREKIHQCIEYLKFGGQDPQYSLVEWNHRDRLRDPRISFLIATYAYRKGKLDAAERLCKESIAVTEANAIPFVLPYQFLVEINESRGRSIRDSLAIIGNSIILLNERRKRSNAPELGKLIEEQLWVFGNIVKDAEETTGKLASNLMDESTYVAVVLLNNEYEDSPFEQGKAEYEARVASVDAKWHLQAMREQARKKQDETERLEIARKRKLLRTRDDSWDSEWEFQAVDSIGDLAYLSPGSTTSPGESVDSRGFPLGPRRPLRDQLNRRALSMDPDLRSLVSRVQLTLQDANKSQIASN